MTHDAGRQCALLLSIDINGSAMNLLLSRVKIASLFGNFLPRFDLTAAGLSFINRLKAVKREKEGEG